MKTLVMILAVTNSLLSGILNGDYNAKILTSEQQDSILNSGKVIISNGEPNEVCTRYKLEKGESQKIYRHSEVAEWFVVDTLRHTRKQLGVSDESNGKKEDGIRETAMSPNGRYVAFVKGNNLYIHKLDYGTEVAITKEQDADLISGVSDWLYEEEFGITALFAWSPDSKKIAFVRLDEREVGTFVWQTFLEEKECPQYTQEVRVRYPKAGCANAKASVCIYDVTTKGIVTVGEIDESQSQNDDFYIPRLSWTKNGELVVVRLNRDQNKMEVFGVNAKSTVAHLLYKEESKDYFVNYELFDQWQWLSDDRFVVLSERDGWQRAYLYSSQGVQQRALTPEKMDVTAIYGIDEATQTMYYQAAPTPSTRQVYALDMKKGAITALTSGEGTHSAHFANDYKQYVECYQSFTQPNIYTLYNLKASKASKIRVVEDNAEVKKAWEANGLKEPEMMTLQNDKGQTLEAMLMMPQNGQLKNAKGQYPLVVMQYSGPQSQRVLNRWRKKFEYALMETGYAVLIVDVRGSDCKGRVWRNETYMELGQKEAEDLISAARQIGERSDIDASRMALMGWSYGGYQALMTMSQKGQPFKAGVAIAPVTDWRLYDTAYTERYMRRPQVNEFGYKKASLLNKAEELSGDVLIIHGMADDNVHVQHVMQYIDALVKADKQFEMQLYPDDNHQLKRDKNAEHMHHRVLRFLEKELGL
ncbi:MAG: S9 family peptidase [Paludibacteraceae bacterium]|nr:S9 family peptidase [Paludibacteraceae bacterium]